ncbi:MAG TPA: 3-hydroxyacyl-CoA dehydrogenase NAD-binding domain-containing protein [Candidatus Polarisedimenticolaceae bacterium]|nr:3-hydroxyacyl-CoA dehydrogenase NAD-binding domain-containing protein [Candidatus Polarisedimenticolaceae bacterium]
MSDPSGMNHWIDPNGIVHIVFDRPNDKVNLLTPAILEDLGQLLDSVHGRDEVRGLLFASTKPDCFIAGMDVEVIASFTDAFKAAEGARFGQIVFQKIADLPVPSAAAIGGTCLGGGTELALACTVRVAADTKATKIGLPETQLGIIPGFGGTQRLPRLVGLTTALDLILTGKQLDAKRALRAGVVDLVAPEEYLERETIKLMQKAASGLKRRRPLVPRLVESIAPVRRFVLQKAEKATAAKVTPEAYPAPFRAIEAIDAAFALPLSQGLDLEARIVGELVPTRTSKNLIWIFKSQSALKKDAGGIVALPRKVRRAAVLGAGIMGGGIAQLIADKGIPVRMKDVRGEALLTALRHASGLWKEQVVRKRLSPREMRQKLGFIAPTLDDTGFAKVDIVLEAVVENLEVKQKVLAAMEEKIGDRAVFASNTSTLPISDIAARAVRPERVVGLHFFNPVHRMPLVEVIAGVRSSPEAVATVHAFARELGKVPVVVRDAPGFLVNRILMLYFNEALRLLAEGVTIDAADAAMRDFGMPMGPFALLDEIGLDTGQHAAAVLEGAFGKRIGAATPILQAQVAAGRLGKKNGKGFYHYKNGKRTGSDPAASKLASSGPELSLPVETLQERMVLAMVNEAAVCLEDGVVREPRDVDIGMVFGTGFPPFRGGLLRYADSIGLAVLVDRLARLADSQGERFRPAPLLRDMVREERRFYPA